MNRMVKRYVGCRDIVNGSGRVIARIERDPHRIIYRHITDVAGAPPVFLNLSEVRDYYHITKS